jgi:hypothetical protein
MSQTENNSEVVSWFIDRTPDYNTEISEDTIVEENSDYVESTDYLAEYEMTSQYDIDRRIREDLFLQTFHHRTNLIASRLAIFRNNDYYDDIDYEYNNNEESEDFISFGNPVGRNLMNSSQVNFIVHEFELSEEEKTCCICIDEKDDDKICLLNCRHKFCVECINSHLKKNQNCPLCRAYITEIRTQTFEARQQIHP